MRKQESHSPAQRLGGAPEKLVAHRKRGQVLRAHCQLAQAADGHRHLAADGRRRQFPDGTFAVVADDANLGPQLGEPPMELKRLSLLAAILVSLLLGTAGAVSSAAAFPGLDNCGSGCDLLNLSSTLINQYGVQLEFLSLVLAAAVIGALTLAKTDRKSD